MMLMVLIVLSVEQSQGEPPWGLQVAASGSECGPPGL